MQWPCGEYRPEASGEQMTSRRNLHKRFPIFFKQKSHY